MSCHNQIAGKVSPWINPDAADPKLAQRSAAALQQELNWAAFLGLQAVLLPPPQQAKGAFNFAQVVNQVSVLERQGGPVAVQPCGYVVLCSSRVQGCLQMD
jgi:hypothetical protein